MELDKIRDKLREKYYEIDKESGDLFLLSVLFEEVGELAEAVRKQNKDDIEEELCDVLFMILSIANLYDANPEKMLVEKYINNDPSYKWDLR